jgi:anti-sigma factor RsiW
MSAQTERRLQLDAFVDGELDLESQLEMERQLEADAALRQQVEEMRQVHALVREKASYHVAPAALRRRLSALATPSERPAAAAQQPARAPVVTPARERARAIGAAVQRWLGWRPLGAALAFSVVFAVALNVLWLQSSKEERLTDDVVASHVRATLGQRLVDVASSDHHTVKPFLSSKLGFSPPVRELGIAGSALLGGRVDYVDGHPVAALVYRQGEHVVDAFVWPSTATDSKPAYASGRGYRTAHWTQDGMTHWVVSDVNREEFRTVVEAISKNASDR